MSLCPRARAGEKIPGQNPLSRDILGKKHIPKKLKKNFQFCRFMPFSEKNSDCPLLFRIPSLLVARFWACPICLFVPGHWRNFCSFVPKSCTVPSCWAGPLGAVICHNNLDAQTFNDCQSRCYHLNSPCKCFSEVEIVIEWVTNSLSFLKSCI